MMKNIIFIITDGIRNYKTDSPRGKLKIMEEFSKESIEMNNCVCSGPSSVMAISAVLTSLPAYFLSKTFSEFKYKNKAIPSLNNLLPKFGYRFYGISCTMKGRTELGQVIDLAEKKFWLGYEEKKNWTGKQLNKVVDGMLSEMQKPFFFIIHFHDLNEKNLSGSVRDSLELIKKHGLYDDSVILLGSDHGTPDEKIKREEFDGWSHDMFVTEDNLVVPMYIKYPGAENGKKIVNTVSHLDIAPTLLSILGINEVPETFKGRDLLGLLEGKTRTIQDIKIRSDNRYINQPGRVTSIRTSKFKYVYYHDGLKKGNKKITESFFDLEKDPKELNDLINSKRHLKIIGEFKDFFLDTERKAKTFHRKYVTERRFYLARKLYERKGHYAKNPNELLRDTHRQLLKIKETSKNRLKTKR